MNRYVKGMVLKKTKYKSKAGATYDTARFLRRG
jgi:hypothetical protein